MHIIGEKKRIVQCPLCGIGLEAATDQGLDTLKEEMKKAEQNYIERMYEEAKNFLWGKQDGEGKV